ncbi:MAG: glycosyltransferase [Cyanobacteria bacterium REEB459]|nr:glycosyltransferase [Cyanobacteria bacterium REEB459]
MRNLYFLLPGTDQRYACGGLFAELKTLRLAQQVCSAAVVTYDQREPDRLFLDDLLQSSTLADSIFVVSWGFHVPRLVRRLRSHQVVYHAHSTGYGFTLPADVPIITVSRNSLAYWGQRSSNGLLFYLPNSISAAFTNHHQPRDIDVLVQTRKSSEYLLKTLVPALQSQCYLVCLDNFVEDLAGLFNRSRVYLYDSAEYWALSGVSEGFGLPPMEAIACGCQVFSSLNGALADYLDPGFNCQKIGVYSTTYDLERILRAIQDYPQGSTGLDLDPYRDSQVVSRLRIILAELNHFFDHRSIHEGNVPGLGQPRLSRLQLQRWGQKLGRKLRPG